MEQKSNAFLETEKLGALMRKYSLPCIISLVVAALYNIVDQIFIANADYLGSYGNVANTVVFPLTVVALAIAVMIGDGACAFVSISLGADRKDDAHRYLQALGKAGPSMILSLVREIIFGVFLPILLPRFFGLDGVLYSFPTADVLTFILTVIVILQVYRELSAENRIINMKTEARALSAP